MASNGSPIRRELRCGLCSGQQRSPRVSRCGHSFCCGCLQKYLTQIESDATDEPAAKRRRATSQNDPHKTDTDTLCADRDTADRDTDNANTHSASSTASTSVVFRCPLAECLQEFTVPSYSIDNFPPSITIAKLVEEEALRSAEPVCPQHRSPAGLFCLTCEREFCNKCLSAHAGHTCRDSDGAVQFYIDKCRQTLDENQLKLQLNTKVIHTIKATLDKEEEHLEKDMDSLLQLFSSVKEILQSEEETAVTSVLHTFSSSVPLKEVSSRTSLNGPLSMNARILKSQVSRLRRRRRATEPLRALRVAQRAIELVDLQLALSEKQREQRALDTKPTDRTLATRKVADLFAINVHTRIQSTTASCLRIVLSPLLAIFDLAYFDSLIKNFQIVLHPSSLHHN